MNRSWVGVGLSALCLAAGVARAATLQGVTPGLSTRAEMHRRLGEPVGGKGTAIETFKPKDAALSRIVVHYRAGDVVGRARFEPAAELTLQLAVLLFEIKGKPRMTKGHPFDPAQQNGEAAHYDTSGVHFHLRDDIVREIWLVVPGDNGPQPAAPKAPAAAKVTPTPDARPGKIGGLTPGGMAPAGPGLVLPTPQPRLGPVPGPEPEPLPQPRRSPVPTPGVVRRSMPKALASLRIGRSSPGGARAAAFQGLVVGRSTRREARAELGPPRFVSRYADDAFACEYDGRRFDLRSVVVRFRPDGVVAQIEQQFLEPLMRAQVLAVLGLGRPATTLEFEGSAIEVFPETGVELSLRHGGVTGLRLATVGSPAMAEAPRPTPAAGPPVLRQKQRTSADAEAFLGTQRVRVRRVWYKADARAGKYRGLMVLADLLARDCKSRTMVAQVRLRQHDGRPVMAAQGAPERFADARGRFVAPAPDEVLHDPATWEAYQVFLPYDYIALPRGQMHHIVITFTAACDDDTNGLEAVCSFRMP